MQIVLDTVAQTVQEHNAARKAELESAICIVAAQWQLLIENEGSEAAKRFMQECRERQYSPSSYLDWPEFLDAGKMALKVHFRAQINSSI